MVFDEKVNFSGHEIARFFSRSFHAIEAAWMKHAFFKLFARLLLVFSAFITKEQATFLHFGKNLLKSPAANKAAG